MIAEQTIADLEGAFAAEDDLHKKRDALIAERSKIGEMAGAPSGTVQFGRRRRFSF
jgi:hypothetical protein